MKRRGLLFVVFLIWSHCVYKVIQIIVCKTISNLRWINICLYTHFRWDMFDVFSQLIDNVWHHSLARLLLCYRRCRCCCCCCLNDQNETIRTQKTLVEHFVWPHFKRFRQVPHRTVVRAMFRELYLSRRPCSTQNVCTTMLWRSLALRINKNTAPNTHYTRFPIYISHVINSSTGWLGVGSEVRVAHCE